MFPALANIFQLSSTPMMYTLIWTNSHHLALIALILARVRAERGNNSRGGSAPHTQLGRFVILWCFLMCFSGCYGGYARVSTVINEQRPVHNSSLFLNAGDEFQGTLFYSYYGGEKIAETINQLGFDGMTLGNHEFDGGDDMLGAFLVSPSRHSVRCKHY